MIEKLIYLEGVDPVVFFGVNNVRYEKIRNAFPKVKIVARGNEIKTMGEKTDVQDFEKKIDLMIQYLQKYNNISEFDLDLILNDDVDASLKLSEYIDDVIVYGNNGQGIKARTVNQRRLADEFKESDLLFAIGPAGTGKTYTAIALAVMAFKNKAIKRIILTRPAVEAGEHLGFLPGDMKEKLDPYLQPLYDALHDMIPAKKLESLMEDGTIQIAPLAYMRGRTLDQACVILDEAQNSTINQLKMFLTRMGKSAKFIVNGDLTQIDLPNKSNSGLNYALKILGNIKGISMIHFDNRDIVRHRLVKDIIEAYDKASDEVIK
jgi:phosphate starvation-inducible protein PhoH and related proteins